MIKSQANNSWKTVALEKELEPYLGIYTVGIASLQNLAQELSKWSPRKQELMKEKIT